MSLRSASDRQCRSRCCTTAPPQRQSTRDRIKQSSSHLALRSATAFHHVRLISDPWRLISSHGCYLQADLGSGDRLGRVVVVAGDEWHYRAKYCVYTPCVAQ